MKSNQDLGFRIGEVLKDEVGKRCSGQTALMTDKFKMGPISKHGDGNE